jgi:hemerythrin-like domain-containing protein
MLKRMFPIEDIKIISVVIEEFVDRFHYGKEEQAYFIEIKHKNGFSEDIRKFLIGHDLGRRITALLLCELRAWMEGITSREPVARFLFLTDHTSRKISSSIE